MTTHVTNAELVETCIGRWNAGDLAFIESVRLDMNPEGEATLRIGALFQRADAGEAWPDRAKPFARVELLFGGVRDFAMKGFGAGLAQVMGFYIDDVSDRGLEDIRFGVGDYEDGRISFHCHSAEVVDVSATELSLP